MRPGTAFLLLCALALLGVAGCSDSGGSGSDPCANWAVTKDGEQYRKCVSQMQQSPEWRRAEQLLEAVEVGNSLVVLRMLDQGVPIEARGANGMTPLMAASRRGDVRIVRELLRRGADPNAMHRMGTTPLTLAARQGHTLTVWELLRAGASVSGRSGFKALSAGAYAGRVGVVSVLLRAGADIGNHGGPQCDDLQKEAKYSEVLEVFVSFGKCTRKP